MVKQKALGMGLGALISNAATSHDTPAPKAAGTEEVRLDLIDVNPYQPRDVFDEDALNDLAESIRQMGLIQPVTVCRTDNGRYQIISGERRFRAAQRAGLQTVPVFIRASEDNRQLMLMALEENLQREDLDAIEIALAYQRLMDEFKYTQEELSATVSKKRSTVANFLRLLRLPPEIQFAIKRRAISMGHARALLSIQDESQQLQILNEIIEKDMSVRATEERVASLSVEPKIPSARRKADLPSWMQEARNTLTNKLQTRVDIKCGSTEDTGRIVINFASQDDLQRIMDHLNS